MRLHLLVPLVVATLLTGCSGGGPSTSARPSQPGAGPAAPPGTQIEVRPTDQMTIEPGTMTIAAGQPVTFVVTNVGAIDHEFYLGGEQAQAQHEAEMAGMPGMGHHDAMGIALNPGETKQLTVTFDEPGTTLAGCHVSGHFGAGMKATVQIAS